MLKKPKKRGPKEERPVIKEDPQEALTRLLKPSKKAADEHAAVEAARAEFRAAHEAGKKALKTRDFKGIHDAIERERDLIEQQAKRVERQRSKFTK